MFYGFIGVIDCQSNIKLLSFLFLQLLEDVVGISIIRNGKRLSVNAQQRKSIDDYYNRVENSKDIFSVVETVLHEQVEPQRLGISHEVRNGNRVSWIDSFPAIRNLCNISPVGFSTTVIDGVCRLGMYYNLSMPELFSCQKAYETVPHTQYFFEVGSPSFIKHCPYKIRSSVSDWF